MLVHRLRHWPNIKKTWLRWVSDVLIYLPSTTINSILTGQLGKKGNRRDVKLLWNKH